MVGEKEKEELFLRLRWDLPEIFGLIDMDISLNKLKSKRNSVYAICLRKSLLNFPEKIVLKLYNTENFKKETKVLSNLSKQKINVPDILFFRNPYLLLNKIEGINLCDFINERLLNSKSLEELKLETRKELKTSIKSLAEWFAILHSNNIVEKDYKKVMVLNKGDARLRDFIYDVSTQQIFGTDFEDSYEGNHVDDLAWVCCSLLDTNPGIFEIEEPIHKMELINIFLREYYAINTDFQFSFEYFADTIIEYLNIVISRRNLNIGRIDKKSILKRIFKTL
ncbi:MAG: hypothetical protein GF317_11260 [Candidatus Lokiarchaeota archaeon]|nr:hypothetical protein [Candidatus Lokiarchaeota archaeon]MBD3200227.1 hypothetical protein [Candidatus Lokiarchaeota archaeon]